MPTHRDNTNAPIICTDIDEVVACAEAHHAQLIVAEDDVGVISLVVDASKSGRWVCLLTKGMSNEMLREVVYHVWLKSNWAHHPDFRAWFVDPTFVPPPKEELIYGFGAPRLEPIPPRHGDVDMSLLPECESSASRLPYLLVRSAVYLQYASDFDTEFRCRELITAVADLEMYRTEEAAKFAPLLHAQDLIDLFRLANREDVMCSLVAQAEGDASIASAIVSARDRDGRSALDIAIEKDFKRAAVLLRNLGCKSETFKFERLLDPNFQPMLKELIDPWKQFPFDPVKSLQKVALGGQGAILRKLFQCRVDVDFGFSEYPLAEACESGCDDVAWIVLDRMSATGVNPFQDYAAAAYHLVRTLMYCFEHPRPGRGVRKALPAAGSVDKAQHLLDNLKDPNAPDRSQTKLDDMEPLSATADWVLHRLADVCLLEGKRFLIPLKALCRAESYKELMPKLLQLVDITKEPNTEGLLEFFIFFDPANELSRQLTRKAITDVGASGTDVEEKVYRLVWSMVRQGERALQMAHWSFELVAFRHYFPFTFRGDGGATVLMKCLDRPPNVGALNSLLNVIPNSVKRRAMDQPDLNGNSALKRLVVALCQAPDAHADYLPAYGDAVRLMLSHGFEVQVQSPEFTADLFTMCAREDLGEVCYELLNTRVYPGSIILACSMNTLALMWRRHRRVVRKTAKQPPQLTSIFEDSETKWLPKPNHADVATDVMDGNALVTNIVDATKPASSILTTEEREPYSRFTVESPAASAACVTVLDARVEKARLPHPTFGDNILTLLDLEVLSHICTFVPLKSLRLLCRVSTSWFYASLFDNVWIDRQLGELFPKKPIKQLRTLNQHAAHIIEDAAAPNLTTPAIDFICGAHSLESCRSIFIMHASEHW